MIACYCLLQTPSIVDTAIQMAVQPSSIYHKVQGLFAMIEEGNIKKTRELKGRNLLRAIEGKLSANSGHFKMFQGLSVHSFMHTLVSCTYSIFNTTVLFTIRHVKLISISYFTQAL